MLIRKEYKFEGAHVVRNCSSDRCKRSIHGHSYVVEVLLEGDILDKGMMIYDFGLMKTTIGELIDSFDHTYVMWSKESNEFKTFMKNNSRRCIELPVSPSAECFSLVFLAMIDKIIQNTNKVNGEGNIKVNSVIVHETRTGYAQSFRSDLHLLADYSLNDIWFSDGVKEEWKFLVDDWDHVYTNSIV